MTDAPERIWAVPERNCTVYMSGNSPITAQDGPFTHRLHGAASEYIRADLVEAMETENRRLREALEPFAAIADLFDSEVEGHSDTDELSLFYGDGANWLADRFTLAQFNAARAALSSGEADL